MAVTEVLLLVISVISCISSQNCPGLCEDSTVNSCGAGWVSGLCPGSSNIQCCEMATPNCNGQCQDSSLPCSGSYLSGDCPGPSNVQCCSSGGPTPPPPPPTPGQCSTFANAEWNCADPQCSSTVCTGCGQPNYECAEFVARSLASGGLIPLGPYDSQSEYGSFPSGGNTYDLLWVSSKNGGILGLDDYLNSTGWNAEGTDPSTVNDCSALMVVGSEGDYSHTVVGVAPQIVDAHNVARYQVQPSFYNIDNIWNPPSNIYQIVAKQREEYEQIRNDPVFIKQRETYLKWKQDNPSIFRTKGI